MVRIVVIIIIVIMIVSLQCMKWHVVLEAMALASWRGELKSFLDALAERPLKRQAEFLISHHVCACMPGAQCQCFFVFQVGKRSQQE